MSYIEMSFFLTQYEDEISTIFELLQFDGMGKWHKEFGRNAAF